MFPWCKVVHWNSASWKYWCFKYVVDKTPSSNCNLQGVSEWTDISKSALRSGSINNFIDLWYLVALGGLGICVSSNSCQKNDMGWPQQPPTEKMLKFNMIFQDSTPKHFFSKHRNEAEFKCLNNSEVLSSDFPVLKHLQPQ